MFRGRRVVKPVLALIAVAALAFVIVGCANFKAGSLAGTQPAGIGSVRVHFVLCTVGKEVCSANEKNETLQYLVGIAVPAGSTPPASFTAVPLKGGSPIAFTRSDEVASEMAAAAASLQKLFEGAGTQKEKEEAEQIKTLLGGPWPPSGMQGVGYISAPVAEAEAANLEWSVDADFSLPAGSGGAPFTGPFGAAIAYGFREVEALPASRPVHCIRFDESVKEEEGDAFCGGTVQQVQVGTSDLTIGTPQKTAQAFVGGKGQVALPLNFAGTAASAPTFSLSATTTAKGGKTKLASTTFAPGAVDAGTHLAPTGIGKVTVSVPRSIKPGTYNVSLSATAAQGGSVTGTAKLKVVKPKLKLSVGKINAANGTTILKVKVPGAGKLTIRGKDIVKATKKTKKAKTLKVTIKPNAATRIRLSDAGSAQVKVKATFKPTSGISVSKTKTVVLLLH
jgi:hypothetical protein